MQCRAGTPRRHGLRIGGHSRPGIERQTAAALRAEQRSNRLNGSEMNKIIRSTALLYAASRGETYMSKLAIVAAILPAAAWRRPTHLAEAAISEPGVYAFYHPDDLPSASCPAKSAAYLVSRSNGRREPTDISHWD
jgi:hypothetical protein